MKPFTDESSDRIRFFITFEIDFIANHSQVANIIESGSGLPTLDDVMKVIRQYKSNNQVKPLYSC